MAEKRKRRRQEEGADPPTKEEYAVAKFLRFNCPVREGKLVGMTVQCFIASRAVDALLESKWALGKAESEPLFTTRYSCVLYCDRLLQKGLFHRAAKVEKKKGEKSKKKKKLKEGEKEEENSNADEEKLEKKSKKDRKSKKEKEKEKEEVEKTEDTEKKTEREEKKQDEDKEKKKREKKFKLVMHDDQVFKDGEKEVYVWIYDPVPLRTFVIGLLLVLGAIGLCLFPLWPSEVRVGVYYLSLTGAVFVGFILFLIVVRFILFCMVWGLTLGKHHFWFLPNLTEDVGFFDSFKPLYKHEYNDGSEKDKEKTTKKDKSVDNTAENETKSLEAGTKTESDSENKMEHGNWGSGDGEEQNGFELVEKEDLDQYERGVGEPGDRGDVGEPGDRGDVGEPGDRGDVGEQDDGEKDGEQEEDPEDGEESPEEGNFDDAELEDEDDSKGNNSDEEPKKTK